MSSDLPAYTDFFNPVLDAIEALGGSARPGEVRDWITEKLGLSDEQLAQEHDSGVNIFDNRVAWARFYLAKTGYIDSSRRGVWALTDRGRAVDHLTDADVVAIRRQVQATSSTTETGDEPADPTDEQAASGRGADHREQIKALLRKMPPDSFERFCQRLLREAGFESVEVTGRSGDGGIDGHGLLRVNPLVSFLVMFQSKRYSKVIGSPQVRDFRGAMTGRADRGLLITTSTFSRSAEEEASRDGAAPIELIDGDKIVDLLEELELGLTREASFGIEPDFFQQFD